LLGRKDVVKEYKKKQARIHQKRKRKQGSWVASCRTAAPTAREKGFTRQRELPEE
jgi:hypothetical protein